MTLLEIEKAINDIRLDESLNKDNNIPEFYAISACYTAFQGYRYIIEIDKIKNKENEK